MPATRFLFAAGLGLAGAVTFAQTAAATEPSVGPKKTVAVEQFQATESTGGSLTADGMTALLTAALVQDGRFVVLERPGLLAVQAEQALGQSGAANIETAARPGQLIGASVIVRAAVTKFQPNASGGGLTLGGMNMGRLGSLLSSGLELKNQNAMMEIGLRLIDTTTGQVVSTSAAQGTAGGSSLGVTATNTNSGLSLGAMAFRNSPMGQAGEQAILKAVELIAAAMRNVPWAAQVVDVADAASSIYVSAGADRSVTPGLVLAVYRKGRVLTDPSTGLVLDVELRKLGTARVTAVRERVSIAQFEGAEPPARGDILGLEAAHTP